MVLMELHETYCLCKGKNAIPILTMYFDIRADTEEMVTRGDNAINKNLLSMRVKKLFLLFKM